jgi:SAM-dependent methyltransferase
MSYSGNYPLEHRAGEIDRLVVQSRAMAPDAAAMLERFGPMQGWRCLDIGCGPGGITDLLAARVGPAGHVIGIDRDAEFLQFARAHATAPHVEFRLGDAYDSDLPAGSFDLVHMRFVASTSGSPERLLQEASRLARRGGIVALQEPDGSTLNIYPPHPAWDLLKSALLGTFKAVGADLELAKRLYFLAYHAGLRDVEYRTALLAVRSSDPMIDYLPSTIESLQATIVKFGLLDHKDLAAALAACRGHLAQPATSFTMYTLAQVWGRTTVPSPL